jgi:hypothetical protein
MINLYKHDGEVLYGIKEFLLDSPEDLSQLPTNVKTGSTALIISSSALYMLNGNKQWVEIGGMGNTSSNNSANEKIAKFDANNNDLVDSIELNEF